MNDLSAVAVFLTCFVVTFGLVWACAWLMPRQADRPAEAKSKEARP